MLYYIILYGYMNPYRWTSSTSISPSWRAWEGTPSPALTAARSASQDPAWIPLKGCRGLGF